MNLNCKVPVIDITRYINNSEVDDLYTEDVYGGHFSAKGNKLVADVIFDYLNNNLN
jgi:hypothetical protein